MCCNTTVKDMAVDRVKAAAIWTIRIPRRSAAGECGTCDGSTTVTTTAERLVADALRAEVAGDAARRHALLEEADPVGPRLCTGSLAQRPDPRRRQLAAARRSAAGRGRRPKARRIPGAPRGRQRRSRRSTRARPLVPQERPRRGSAVPLEERALVRPE